MLVDGNYYKYSSGLSKNVTCCEISISIKLAVGYHFVLNVSLVR